MSKRVGILAHTQSVNDHPSRFVSKSGAASLVRHLLCVWISERIIQEVKLHAVPLPDPSRFYSRPALEDVIVTVSVSRRKEVPEKPLFRLKSPNLDLDYPEAYRATVLHRHEAFFQACLDAKKQQKAQRNRA